MTNDDVPTSDDTVLGNTVPDDKASADVDAPVLSSNEDATAEKLPPHEKVRKFPTTPGVYLMKDQQGRVIYVGKAKSLRDRLRSYVKDGDGRYQIRFLMY